LTGEWRGRRERGMTVEIEGVKRRG